ncbi:hypothetical protein ACLQ28_21770 [Micromonospora sp. DT201]|uniref:hypothetical protein n=1 Tax=Micromonospora sp. DT201 TaxID=3393442 RepID=UPI003CF0F79B
MGNLVDHPLTTAAASLVAVLVVALKAFLLWRLAAGWAGWWALPAGPAGGRCRLGRLVGVAGWAG